MHAVHMLQFVCLLCCACAKEQDLSKTAKAQAADMLHEVSIGLKEVPGWREIPGGCILMGCPNNKV